MRTLTIAEFEFVGGGTDEFGDAPPAAEEPVQTVTITGSREEGRTIRDIDDGFAGVAGTASAAATVAFVSGFATAAGEGAALGAVAGPVGIVVGAAVGVAVVVVARKAFRNAGSNLP